MIDFTKDLEKYTPEQIKTFRETAEKVIEKGHCELVLSLECQDCPLQHKGWCSKEVEGFRAFLKATAPTEYIKADDSEIIPLWRKGELYYLLCGEYCKVDHSMGINLTISYYKRNPTYKPEPVTEGVRYSDVGICPVCGTEDGAHHSAQCIDGRNPEPVTETIYFPVYEDLDGDIAIKRGVGKKTKAEAQNCTGGSTKHGTIALPVEWVKGE